MTETPTIKNQLNRIAERLPVDATWDDVLYEIYVSQEVESGLKDCREGRKVFSEEVRRRLGLPQYQFDGG